ncbi:anthrone oxygenase family protein [Saccharomonospora sp. NB11]|uniref:anthrone oxygenase family protein n=1 Tax=Saccharomonospora sp. NB11 TaxID=1642298 RepID=UPI0027DC1517|nr:anthrone oxygenase family protein [Saccharomonospora sp. NB11]
MSALPVVVGRHGVARAGTRDALVARKQRILALSIAGAALHVGTVGITRIAHLPRNWALDNASDGSEAAQVWARYVGEWTRWNHVRTAASAAASIVFTVILVGG